MTAIPFDASRPMVTSPSGKRNGRNLSRARKAQESGTQASSPRAPSYHSFVPKFIFDADRSNIRTDSIAIRSDSECSMSLGKAADGRWSRLQAFDSSKLHGYEHSSI